MKKALSLILTFVIVLGMIPMAALPTFAETVEYTVIDSITDITGAGNYKLADDYAGEAEGTTITAPIALTDDTVIDGNGKTVTNLTVKASGLFGLTVGKTLTVKNITFGTSTAPITQTGNGDSGLFVGTIGNDKVAVTTAIFENVDVYVNSTHTGTIAGMVGAAKENGQFFANNCSVNGTISTAASYAGGYIGYAQCSVVDIKNSVNNASVTSETAGGAAGGFVGFNHNSGTSGYLKMEKCLNTGNIKTSNTGNSSAGGIIGQTSVRVWTIDIIDCVNRGTVTDAVRAGGILGYYNPSAATEPQKTIKGCVNYGTVTTAGTAGGILGEANATTKNLSIDTCVNYGTITTDTIAGGILGKDDYSPKDNVVTSATENLSINACVNHGVVTAKGDVGGIVGNHFGKTVNITKSINHGALTSTNTGRVGGIVGLLKPMISTESAKTISGCINHGTVTTDGLGGGMLGVAEGSANNLTVANCVNYGAVKEGNKLNRGGGILGYDNVKVDHAITIDGCINYGKVGGRSAGGVVGLGNVTNSLSVIKNCASLGDVKGDVGSGGITGKLNGGTVINCVVGDISISTHTSTAVSAYVTNEAISGATVKNVLNLSNVTVATSGATITTDALYSVGSMEIAELLAAANSDTGYTDGDVTYKFTDIAGKFTYNSTSDNLVLVTPAFEGHQLSRVDADNKFKVRLLATINDVRLSDPCEYYYLGMEININGKTTYYSAEYVYSSVLGSTDSDGIITYTAEELGGKYIYAAIATLDATVDNTIIVRTFAGATENTDDLYYGESYTINLPASVAASN